MFNSHGHRRNAMTVGIVLVLTGSLGISVSAAKPIAKPKVSKAATITGMPKSESILKVAKGTWLGAPKFTYKWYACATSGTAKTTLPTGCSAISGATGTTLTLTTKQESKFIRVVVTAKNAGGTAISASATSAKITSPYALLWSEEFNGPIGIPASVRTSTQDKNSDQNWDAVVTNSGGGNRERQFYTDGVASYNEDGSVAHNVIELDGDGHLVINAVRTQEASGNKPSTEAPVKCYYGDCEFLSGRLESEKHVGFKYGMIEVRAKIPSTEGTWPAFWMLGMNHSEVDWPRCGEIDILEAAFAGARIGSAFGSLHSYPDNGFGVSKTIYPDFLKLYSEYHTFGMLREPDQIKFLFDGVPYFTITKAEATSSKWAVSGKERSWPFDQEFYAILNLAMGGTLGGGPGGSVTPDATGGSLLVDWIRFHSYNGQGEIVRH